MVDVQLPYLIAGEYVYVLVSDTPVVELFNKKMSMFNLDWHGVECNLNPDI
jgi:hypothetical protein